MQENNSVTEQVDSLLSDINSQETEFKPIFRIDDDTIKIDEETYYVVVDYRDGFQLEAFKDLYDEYFEKFDFIVGDWAYDKLRLRGFYQLNQKRVPQDQTIGFLDDYIKEYCNFGCAYFVIGKKDSVEEYERLITEEELYVPKADFSKGRHGGITTKKRSNRSKRRRQREMRQQSKQEFVKKDVSSKNKQNKKTNSSSKKKDDSSFIIRNKK